MLNAKQKRLEGFCAGFGDLEIFVPDIDCGL